ncbi:MAG: pyridoxamine 5'-phosphate oxidase family protein [Pseudomonadota bacterium]
MSRIAALREDLGGAHPRAATKVKDYLEPYVQAFIENASFAVMASSNGDGDCDASPKGGKPGWVKIVNERTLLLPDIGGNRLFQSYENFETNPKAGFVFIIPGMETTARVNGRVEILEPDQVAQYGIEPDVHAPDANSGLVQGFLLHIDEAYFHCPRSMRFADIWNTDMIEANKARNLKSLKGE